MSRQLLHNFQAEFREYLYSGRHEHKLASRVRNTSEISAEMRLEVYRNDYFVRLEQSLAHDFPITEKILGQAQFAKHAGNYVLQHPSESPTLRDLGRHLEGWLRKSGLPVLADLAALEWAVLYAFDGPDHTPVTNQQMNRLVPEEWPSASVELAPTLTLIQLGSNAEKVWSKSAENIQLEPAAPCAAAVWRGPRGPVVSSVDAAFYHVFKALKNEADAASACDRLGGKLDPALIPETLAAALQWLLQRQCITAFDTNNSAELDTLEPGAILPSVPGRPN